jgi:uncharacterized protein YqgC (DUF456 family)
MSDVLAVVGNVLFLVVGAVVLLLHAVGLPANWILLGLALLYALITGLSPVGWGTLLVLAALAGLAELLEFGIGVGYTAKRGATRWGLGGAFVGGIGGGVALSSVVPPFGSLVGVFLGSFLGAVLFEYIAQERLDAALRSGRAAFFGRVFGAVVKTMCGFWMWGVLVWRIFFARP